MKLLTILGARPQFIKAATISRAIAEHNQKQSDCLIQEKIVHTGQHFDANMSDVFFEQLDIPRPNHSLGIASLSHGAMTGRMLEAIEGLLLAERPDFVLVYGDTNSTLAGALAATKLNIPIAHVEAGLRSHNLAMPEEINRVLTDRVSDYLFCPTATAVANLQSEGFPFSTSHRQKQQIENVGDVMYDAMLYYQERAKNMVQLSDWGVEEKSYALCTLHRQENTDDPKRLKDILSALRTIAVNICPVLLPLHPRTRKKIDVLKGDSWLESIQILEPVAYLEMQRLEMDANIILTDSGGMQKEAFFHQVPCITLRDETEWTETIDSGWNILAGADSNSIINAIENANAIKKVSIYPYGKGSAGIKIVESLLDL
ncbi:MAG: UDP-N-acetylglucosamine 2-epimerase (non-hydrolyzing) [Pseudomonadales bacterium]|nr:UDP-N-acetylglucosamine 2-epimerase (non-hydrolyzing) [Pseudomonadales bacterium]